MKKNVLFVFILSVLGVGFSGQTVTRNGGGHDGPLIPVNGGPPAWTPAANLLYNMQIIAKLKYEDGSFSLNPDDMVGAFSGNECRGVYSPDPGLFGMVFLTVGANQPSGETITFKAYLSEADRVADLDETLIFLDQQQVGTIANAFVFSCPPAISDTLLLQNITVIASETRCYEAGKAIVTAGSGTFFNVASGATVNLGAGNKISFLSGTHFYHGSSVHAVIYQGGGFCTSLQAKLDSTFSDTLVKPVVRSGDPGFFNIFPNPSSGKITLELPDQEKALFTEVSVYNNLGVKVLQMKAPVFKKTSFDLSFLKAGIYMVRIHAGDRIGMGKVIMQ
ncbi:MAG: T9SS type A sorting domain-containing protein [Bacteroidetes bacterium]|nr:T9SS type A sorting domain-containing protein [Bacteroidota bacterium]